MPAGLPTTPWLQPPNTTENYLKGFGLGQQGAAEQAQINMASQRLQQQAQQTQMEIEAKKSEQDRQYQMDQQKLEIEKAYRQSQIGMEQQRVDQAKQTFDFKTKQAAQSMQAQGQYQTDYDSMVGQGIPEGEASIKAALKNPGFLKGGSGLAAVTRAAQANVPKNLEIKQQEGKQFYRSSPTEAYKMVPGGSEDKVLGHQPAISQFASLRQMEAEYRLADDKTKKKLAPAIEDTKRQLNDYYKSKNQTLPFPKVGTRCQVSQ